MKRGEIEVLLVIVEKMSDPDVEVNRMIARAIG